MTAAAASSLKVSPSNFDCPLMYEISHHSDTDNSVRSSVTACKKVLCSNNLPESTDYWLQNQKIPCGIGIMEEKMDKNCTSVCFVNLDTGNADYNSEFMKQRLVNISPNLPKLIASMNVQPPKDNEIIFLSGLTSENLQADFEVPQCSWLADVCLLQCARGNRRKNTSCIIFEINKFLIGLELVQEKQLHIEAGSLKPEDDTNCSVSSIEEDFLTASEHFEDEDDEYKQGEENLHLGAEFKKYREGDCEDLHCKKVQVPFFLKGSCISHEGTASTRTSESSEEEYNSEAEDVLQTVDEAIKQLNWKVGKYTTTGKCKSLSNTDDQKHFCKSDNNSDKSENVCLTITTKEDRILLDDLASGPKSPLDILNCRDERMPQPPIQNDQAPTGHFATNLAESVLQDAFIRLSQSTFTKETALSTSVSNPLTSTAHATQNEMACRSWNVLPKIVIVQSPDGSDKSEWPGSNFPSLQLWSEVEHSSGADFFQDSSPSKSTQSTLEVALVCAASVIGTISSPHAAEKLKEKESMSNAMTVGNRKVEKKTPQSTNSNCNPVDYPSPPALSHMAQMANIVAVPDIGEIKDMYPVTSSGLLSAAETSAAVTLHCSIAIGSTMENLNNSIAQVLFKEASLVLTRPHAYRTIGEFMESVNGKLVQAATKPSTSLLDEVIVEELAQNLSNIILRHSVEEVRKKQRPKKNTDACSENAQDVLTATANQLLFNVFYFTCKKMNDIAQLNECSNTSIADNLSKHVMDCQPKETTSDVLPQSSSCNNIKLTSHFHDKDGLFMTNLVDDVKEEIVPNALESPPTLHAQSSPSRKTSSKKRYLKRMTKECRRPINLNNNHMKTELCPFSGRENLTSGSEGRHGLQELQTSIITENREEPPCDAGWLIERQLSVPFLDNQGILPSRPHVYLMHPADKYCITDFAEELAETVVSMATEIAAICLDNSNGKQPWFCAWKRGSGYLMPQALPCRPMKRKKEAQTSGSTVRKHRPPRLSEIKRKTDEHPELKEWLMNRVVDDSINLDDSFDLTNNFANEAAAKIMNLAEFSVADNVWQNPNHPQNRLHCDRWNRVNASSCESIPEEDLDSKGPVNTLALINTLGQPISRTSSVSKQSSCESITDEFSRFMVNQMETEGREFDLLLDYYAGKNANNIITSALQQVTKKNGHLNVKSSCPSKQSSTESITEEFYRYMLREVEKEYKEKVYSTKNAKEWSSSLLLPSQRSSFCFRQSSVPDSRSSTSRLTVNMPIKANSLDGFSHNGHRDSLNVYPVNTASSSGLCKSDSYLYQRCRTDQVTDMLIHETWANSIKDLMCKNKIILDNGEVAQPDQHPYDSPPHVQQYAQRLAANIVESGKTLITIHQDSTKKDHVTESSHIPSGMQNYCKPCGDRRYLDEKEQQASFPGLFSIKHPSSSCLREVPLIQIDTDQRQDLDNASEPLNGVNVTSGKTKEDLLKGNPIDADSGQQLISSKSQGLPVRSCPESEASVDNIAVEEFPVPFSSSEESTCSSWCQLANNPDDTSSYLQLSERSMSNGNSSTSSSLGVVDLEIYQENIPSSHAFNDLTEGSVFCEKLPEKMEACTSGLIVERTNEQKNLLVINVDLEPEYPDAELRATLQWIAASELGIPMIYFKKSQEHRIEKFLDVVQFVHQKCWKVGDIFHAVVQFCKLHEESKEPTLSLFDWLLELG